MAVGLSLTILAGCASYQAKPIEPAALARSFESRSLDDPALRRYITAHLNHEAGVGEPWNLETLTLAAFYYSPELDMARARWETSQAAARTAQQRPNPTLVLPLGYTANAPDGMSPYLYGLGLDIPIETAGKRGYRLARANELSDAARLQIGVVAWQVRSRLRSALLDLLAASRALEILTRQVAAQEQIVAMLDRRFALGTASTTDVNSARVVLLRSRDEVAQATGRQGASRAEVAKVMGLSLGALRQVNIGFEEFERTPAEIPLDDARRRAVLNRADLRAALARYEASQAALQLEVARQYPDLHISLGYTVDSGANKLSSQFSGIALPVFNRNEGPIAEAEGRRKEAATEVLALQAATINDIDRAVQAHQSALAALDLQDRLLAAQTRVLQNLRRSFDAGETDRLTLISAQSTLETSTLSRLAARVAVQRTTGQLEDAMQQPLRFGAGNAVPADLLAPPLQ